MMSYNEMNIEYGAHRALNSVSRHSHQCLTPREIITLLTCWAEANIAWPQDLVHDAHPIRQHNLKKYEKGNSPR